jgi:hypothetical protein
MKLEARYGFGVRCQWMLDATTAKVMKLCSRYIVPHMPFAESEKPQDSFWLLRATHLALSGRLISGFL